MSMTPRTIVSGLRSAGASFVLIGNGDVMSFVPQSALDDVAVRELHDAWLEQEQAVKDYLHAEDRSPGSEAYEAHQRDLEKWRLRTGIEPTA